MSPPKLLVPSQRPKIFVGSSKERIPIVHALESHLNDTAHVMRWDKHVFEPGDFSLEAVQRSVHDSDFAILVVSGDDMLRSRGKQHVIPRDNIILEAGLALGVLGKQRTFLLYDQADKPKLPTDLLGLTFIGFSPSDPLSKALRDPARRLITAIVNRGLRPRTSAVNVARKERSTYSRTFSKRAIRTLDLFAGDLSWIEEDRQVYEQLIKRNVRVRALCDNPSKEVSQLAKEIGIRCRRWPQGLDERPRLRAALSDSDDQLGARLLVFEKTRSYALHSDDAYDYLLREYSAPDDFALIASVADSFERLFSK